MVVGKESIKKIITLQQTFFEFYSEPGDNEDTKNRHFDLALDVVWKLMLTDDDIWKVVTEGDLLATRDE